MTFPPQTRQDSQVRTRLSTFPEHGRTGCLEAHVVISEHWALIFPSLPASTQAATKCYRLGGGVPYTVDIGFSYSTKRLEVQDHVWTLLAPSKAMFFSLHTAVF